MGKGLQKRQKMNASEKQFAQTVKEHRSTIYTVCYMFSQDADEVEDLFQEVLVNLWKGFEGFEQRADIKTWLYITCGLIYDAWHRRRICRLIDGRHLYEQNLLEVRKKVLKVKKYERTFNIISYPAITLWMVLIFYNSYLTDLHPSVIHTIIAFIIAVAFCFGLCLYLDKKMARHYQDIIQQIEDVTNSEEQEEQEE